MGIKFYQSCCFTIMKALVSVCCFIVAFLISECLHAVTREYQDTLVAHKSIAIAEKMMKEAIFDSAIIYANDASYRYLKANNLKRHLHCMNIIGEAFCNRGKADTALVVFGNVLAESIASYGNASIEVADCYSNIGMAYEGLGNYDSSLANYQKSLSIFQKKIGITNLKVALCYHNIGKIYYYYKDFGTALEFFEKAIKLRLDLSKEHDQDIATSYNYIGLVYQNTGEYDKSLEYFRKALDLRIKIFGDIHPRVAAVYNNIGLVFQGKGDLEQSLDYHRKAYSIRLNVFGENHPDVASSFNNIGIVLFSMEKYDEAIESFKKALDIRIKSLSEIHPEVAMYYNNIGFVYTVKGAFDNALDYQQKALKVYAQLYGNNSPRLAEIYNSIGNSYFHKGEYDKALDHYRIATRYRILLYGEKHYDIAVSYINIGNTYGEMGEYDKSLEYYHKALAMRIELLGDSNLDVAQSYNNIGTVYFDKGEFSKSSEYHTKSLQIRRQILGERHYLVARSYINLSSPLVELGDIDLALKYLSKALEIYRVTFGEQHPDVAAIYSNMAAIYRTNKNLDSALVYFEKSASIREKLLPNKHPLKADVYNSLSDVYLDTKQYENALRFAQKAIVSVCENFSDSTDYFVSPSSVDYLDWRQLMASLDRKASIFKTINSCKRYNAEQVKRIALMHYQVADSLICYVRNRISTVKDQITLAENASKIYGGAIDCCYQLYSITSKKEFVEQAFVFSEKSKSQVLLQSLKSVAAQKIAGIPDTLLSKEHALSVDIAYCENKLAQGLDSMDDARIRNNLFSLNRSLEELIKVFEANYATYSNLKYSAVQISVADIQTLLDKKTCVRSYFVGDSNLYVFTITKNNVDVRRVDRVCGLSDSIQVYRSALIGDSRYLRQYLSCGTYLYHNLFPEGNVNDRHIQKMIIIPDGSLAFIPFESLPTEYNDPINNLTFALQDSLRGFKTLGNAYTGGNYSEYPFLIKKYNISYSYSAALYFQSLLAKKSMNSRKSLLSWIGIAPVFNDPVVHTKELKDSIKNISERVADRGNLLNGEYITPLPGTENEVRSIYKEFTRRRIDANILLKNDAAENKLKSGMLGNYSILHFATHGFVNSEKPELSGILLAQDTAGGNDGMLYSGEMYNLKLNADLTVLSACETGLGTVRKGEGIIGLTRALLYAGSKNIIVSLWPVSDQSTSDLMVNFYKDLLAGKKSQSYSKWLWEAKLKLIKEGKYSNPFYWSPFILIGN